MSNAQHTVLVVDDSATMLMSLQALLSDRGFKVTVAHDGQEGLDALEGGLRPDLIITDIAMPRMDGIAFTREARKRLRFVPILVLTTESQRSRRDEGRALGATGWLLKPVDAHALLGIIAQILPSSGAKLSSGKVDSTMVKLGLPRVTAALQPRSTAQFSKEKQ